MRIRELLEWPPTKFESDGTMDNCPTGAEFHIKEATFIPASNEEGAAGHVIIQLEDAKTMARCSTRHRVPNMKAGRLAADTLNRCIGVTLEEAGNRRIEDYPSSRENLA